MFTSFIRRFLLAVVLICFAGSAFAAPYAAMVVDARTGKVLHQHNAKTPLHPASLTKMMTLYVVFEAIKRREIKTNSIVTVSKNAASQPPSRLGLKTGQKISLAFLIRAVAVKSGNDAAVAVAEKISGSVPRFARRMTLTARAMGMRQTNFKNPHGLTQSGHYSTAMDMTILGRRLFFDYPQYYHLFSRQSINAGVRTVKNTNRHFLSTYSGADGIKTGYTKAAGFNLVASAHRGQKRIITTVFGGSSSKARDARVASLMNLGFSKAPNRARIRKPKPIRYISNADLGPAKVQVASATASKPKKPTTPKAVVSKPKTPTKVPTRKNYASARTAKPVARPFTKKQTTEEVIVANVATGSNRSTKKGLAPKTSIQAKARPQNSIQVAIASVNKSSTNGNVTSKRPLARSNRINVAQITANSSSKSVNQ